MAVYPQSRDAFKQYLLRRLGAPVLNIELSDDQIDDRINDAILMYQQYHIDGSRKQYYSYQIQANDTTNGYIPLPTNIIGVTGVFPFNAAINSTNLFDIRYQIALNDLYTLTSVTMLPYYLTFQSIQLIEQLLVGLQPVRYNQYETIMVGSPPVAMGVLYIDWSWTTLAVGDYIVVECYITMDPDTYPNAWANRWLTDYAEALLKRQWGSNLKKYQGVPLPGGLTLNGQEIYNEADARVDQLKREVIDSFSPPAEIFYN